MVQDWGTILSPLAEFRKKEIEEKKQTEAVIQQRLRNTVEFQEEEKRWEKELQLITTLSDTSEKLKRCHKHDKILAELVEKLKDNKLTPVRNEDI